MSKETDILVSALKDQWARTWAMLEDMIHCTPDREWAIGDIDYLIPARHIIHVTVGEDVFTADMPFDQYDQGKWFGVSAWDSSPDELPSKEAVLDTLIDFRAMVESRLSQLTDKDLLEPEETHPWTGQTRLSKLLFSIRHTQHHLGEVNAELIRRGIEGVKWK